MSRPTYLVSQFIPPPIDGMNLVTPPTMMKPTEALQLVNYLPFDWGIRQVNAPVLEHTFASGIGSLFPYQSTSGTDFVLVAIGTKVYAHHVELGTQTELGTGLGSSLWNINHFNEVIFLYPETAADAPQSYNLGTGVFGLAGWSGPGSVNDLCQGWSYKGRQYAIEKGTSNVWYPAGAAGLGQITGALTQVPLGNANLSRSDLLFGTSWSYNEGINNDELFVLVWENGDVAVFAGDNPDALNWGLVSRTSIPRPIGRKNFRRLGQDILIGTERGLISLAKVFAGRESINYYNTSRNLGKLGLTNTEIAYNTKQPFIYMNAEIGDDATFGDGGIFLQNYERGAWGQIFGFSPSNVTALCWAGDRLFIGTSEGQLQYIGDYGAEDITNAASASMTYVWQTPFLDFNTNLEKTSEIVRLLVRVKDATADKARATCLVSSDFGAAVGSDSREETNVTVDSYTVLELTPAGHGKRLSYKFSQVGDSEINEYLGFDAFYRVGGCY